MVLAYRVKESNYDDVLLEPNSKPAAVGFAAGKRGLHTTFTESDEPRGPIEVPDKIFVFPREDLKPYTRLEKKIMNVFKVAY